MIADQRTLTELGILPRSSRDWPLRPLLDRTHSARAHEALKRVLATPLDSRAAVLQRQRTFRELSALLKDVRWDECLKDCEIVEGFLSSNYVLVPSGKTARTLFALKHREIVSYVANNLHIVSRFLQQGSTLSALLNGLTSDPLIQEVQRSLDAVCHHQALRSIGNVVRSKADLNHRLSEFDQLLRQDMRAEAEACIRSMHLLNALWSLAGVTERHGFATPEITDGETPLLVHGAMHPLLPGGTANDFELHRGERVVFITGPNMAGKSTLLRTLGIIVWFANIGLAVPANVARIPSYDRLISALNAEDNIARGESLYLAEVRRVRTVVAAIANGESVCALLDEAFRGTNVKDAMDATELLVDGVLSSTSGLFLLASHLVEVARSREEDNRFATWYMHVDEAASEVEFTHSLRRGISDVRLGMRLLESEGVVGLLRGMTPA